VIDALERGRKDRICYLTTQKEPYPEWQPRGVAVKTHHLESFKEGHLHEALVNTEA
jgi:hypothetical protein